MKKTRYAFTLTGSTAVYLVGTAFTPEAAASAAATKVAGEPVVYGQTNVIYASLEAYIVPDDFAGTSIGDHLEPEYWLEVDVQKTALAKRDAA